MSRCPQGSKRRVGGKDRSQVLEVVRLTVTREKSMMIRRKEIMARRNEMMVRRKDRMARRKERMARRKEMTFCRLHQSQRSMH